MTEAKLVPVEPTEAMMACAEQASQMLDWQIKAAYRAMLSAAPEPVSDPDRLDEDFLAWLDREIEDADADIGAAHQEGSFATDVEKAKPRILSYVREAYMERRAQPLSNTQELEGPTETTDCKTCGGKGYTEHEGGEGEGYPSRPEIADCLCRSAAPVVGEPVAWRESFTAEEDDGPAIGILIDMPDGSQIWTGDCSDALLAGDERPDESGVYLTVARKGENPRVIASVATPEDGFALARAVAGCAASGSKFDVAIKALERALKFANGCVEASEVTPDGCENPCDLWEALDKALAQIKGGA